MPRGRRLWLGQRDYNGFGKERIKQSRRAVALTVLSM